MPTPLHEFPIRPLTMGDLAHCVELAEDRGWPPEETKWRLLLTAGRGYGIDAPDGDGLAGACVATSYGTPDERGAAELSVIGMMVVAHRYGRQGLGERLMRHVLREADGAPLALYATPSGQPLYERLGFVPIGLNVTVRGRFQATPDATAGLRPGVTLRTATADDLPAVVRLDADVFGIDRTLMITRLPAFTRQLRVATDGPRITGYAATWDSAGTEVIGPLVAEDTATAKALVAALATGTDRPLRTDVDSRHEQLLAWLKEQGVDPVVTTTIMTHGISALPGDAARRFAPLNLAMC